MLITLKRVAQLSKATIGILSIDDKFICFTLEDVYRKIKIPKETRIQAGSYEIKLQTEGVKHKKYLLKYGEKYHKGMLTLQNVPNFAGVMIHIGQSHEDTEGCLLTGLGVDCVNEKLIWSTKSYEIYYPIISEALLKGEKVILSVSDKV